MPLTEPQIFSYNAPVGPHVGSVRTSHSVIPQPLSYFQPYSFSVLTLHDDRIFCHEDGSSRLPHNVATYPPHYMASYHTKQ